MWRTGMRTSGGINDWRDLKVGDWRDIPARYVTRKDMPQQRDSSDHGTGGA